uniref:C2H2-type domain-containing protein n=2 Tax=Emiliania huxleyi TaxID=2903 RepID=A0A7S3WC35_EMIHU
MLNPARLYPTARLQIVRDLFFREWQSRSRHLGRVLYPLYFPDEPEEARAAKTLSAYEEERNRQVLENQQMLVQLGITTLVQDIRKERSEAEKRANERREQPSNSSAPTRASARQASADYNQPNYLPPAMLGEDGEEVEEDEDEEGSVAEISDGSDSDGDASDFDFETLGAPRAPAKPARKAKAAKKKAPTPAIAKAGGERKKKQVRTRGDRTSAAPGGRGFVCLSPDCDEFRDTAEGILEHIERSHPWLEPRREVRNGNEVKCLFDGCANPWVKCGLQSSGNINLHNVRAHEALHSIGDPPRKGFVCPNCDSLHDTADAAWACAATHGIERDNRCLWDGCGETFKYPAAYKAHEPKHTDIWPFNCPTCGEGHTQKERAERHCVIGSACVCGWVSYADRGKSNNEKKLAAHLKRCRESGGLATADTLAVGQIKRRKPLEAE